VTLSNKLKIKEKRRTKVKILGSAVVGNEIVACLKDKKLQRFDPLNLKTKDSPISYSSNSAYRYLTVSRDQRLVLATTNKETRKSNGFALFDATTFEPVLFDDRDGWFSQMNLTADFLAYQEDLSN
jgi:hypothetical protein